VVPKKHEEAACDKNGQRTNERQLIGFRRNLVLALNAGVLDEQLRVPVDTLRLLLWVIRVCVYFEEVVRRQ
jgi:hypothetical protein